MTPDQFLSKIAKQSPAGVYLFLGSEAYGRQRCKEALLNKVLPGDLRESGFTQVSMEELSIPELIDDACSLSLFSQNRVIWAASAEAALPRRLTSSNADGDDDGKATPAALLKTYAKSPTLGTVLVFESSRFEFTGDDKAKIERVAKFYSAIPDVVEFRALAPESLRLLAQDLAQEKGLTLAGRELGILIESVGGNAARLAVEIEKLSLFAGKDRKITVDDLRALVPNASQSNIFNLVSALGRRDRAGAFKALDLLVRDGEYLPLALTFLGTQLRLTLAVQEAGLRNSQQIVSHFSRQGVRMWRDRAEQLLASAEAFSTKQLQRGLQLLYTADKGLRDIRPDDRTVMEMLVLNLTS